MTKNTYPGHLILLVSVPGGGKGTLLRHLKETHPELRYAVSCTSRPIRPGEVDGENYYFLTVEEFQRRIDAGDFLEWIQQDGGRYYGTLKAEIIDRLERGEVVVREVEIKGVRAIKALLPADSLSIIFITAGPWEDMKVRIQQRAPISEEELMHRQQRYEQEIQFATEADFVVENLNGHLDQAKQHIDTIISDILAKTKS